MYVSDEDIEDNMCTCGRYYHGQRFGLCESCIGWNEDHFIVQEIKEAGYKNGMDLGIECAIRHTIYNEARDDYYLPTDMDIPRYAYICRGGYTRAFGDGYTDNYNQVYKRHEPLITELQLYHKVQCFCYWVHVRYENHPLLDPQLIMYILQFISEPCYKYYSLFLKPVS